MLERGGAGAEGETGAVLTMRPPRPDDGPAVTALIRACPPLDANSPYLHLSQCGQFAATCVLAERDGQALGWISAHRPPSDPGQIFVWQVAVHPDARGLGLGGRMLDALVERPAVRGATHLAATVTRDNDASWALFGGFARRHGLALRRRTWFERHRHFAGMHATEWLATIGPLPATQPSPQEDM